MRIISPFHDYYDSLQSYGEPIYLRNTIKVDFLNKEHLWPLWWVSPDTFKIIGFCGQIYPVYRIRDDSVYCYSSEEVDQRVIDLKLKTSYFKQTWSFCQSRVKGLFELAKRKDYKIHFDKAPIFVIHYDAIEYNTQLKNYKFFRVKPIVPAFQELEIWVGNIAHPEKNIPKIPDKTMLQIKGFDKFSFRKDKQ